MHTFHKIASYKMRMEELDMLKQRKKVTLPKGKFCEDGCCGDCVFLDYSRPGSSGTTYYCAHAGKYKEPSETSKYTCSGFHHR